MFCLPKEFANKFIDALKSGKIDPEELAGMTSADRRSYFSDIVGEADAKEVNALFESKLLLKDQKAGLVRWAKQIAGLSEARRTDLLSRIEKMEKVLDPENADAFLEDLASAKLGADVTYEEAQQIHELSKTVEETKAKIPADAPIRSPERAAYGLAFVKFKEYVKDLKTEHQTFGQWLKSPGKWVEDVGGTIKSIWSSFDNSFFGRQGIKILYTKPSIWIRNFAKSWPDIGKELMGVDAMDAIKADVYSRPNALNGKYEAMKLDIGLDSEEAYPSSLPDRIPILGRLFKASETAFNGAALRMRADYADKLITLAEKNGVDMLHKEAQGIGSLVNSMTGRGRGGIVPTSSTGARYVNVLAFSIKFLKANYDTLSAHSLGFGVEKGPARTFVRKQAAINLTKIIGTIAAINTVAELLNPGSTQTDPRGSHFGQIKLGNVWFDPTGGMSSLVTLAARITPTVHNGELGFWSLNPTTKKWTHLTSGKYGQQNVLDVVETFFEGKVSPLVSILRDVWKGETYTGQKPTAAREAQNIVTPLPIQNGLQLWQDRAHAPFLAGMILEGLGFSSSVPNPPKKK